ncbi:MAG: starch-binding protein [Bacteroidales bacterium]|nr:starch-binding protein [Bacteroidales bacterium]
MKKLTFTLLLALMAIFSAQAAKVYLKIGEGRVTAESNLAVWVWEGKNNFCTNKEWPGDKLTEKETIEGADYFVYTVNTEGSYNIIFNNNEKENANTNRTADILGLAGDYTFVLNNEWDGENWSYTKTEGAPGAETPESVETYTVQLRGNAYGTWNAPVTFAYNAETKEYVYEETETAKLADDFKVTVNNTYYKAEEFVEKALDNSLDFVAMNDNYGDMKITDAADYDKITLTVKNDNGTWKLKVVGEKPDKVQIAGKFNSWNGVDMVSNPNGTYIYEVEENMNALSEGFGIVINGVFYAGNTVLDLDGDAVVLTGNPGPGNDLTLIAEGDVASVILTVAKDGDNWTVKAATGKTSSVAGIDAAGVAIAAANGEIVVEGAQSVAVYTAAGALVSTDARTRLAAGLYIVRADNVVKKVIVK